MACTMFSAKSLLEQMPINHQLDHWKQVSVQIQLKFKHFHSRKCAWKYLQNGDKRFQGSVSECNDDSVPWWPATLNHTTHHQNLAIQIQLWWKQPYTLGVNLVMKTFRYELAGGQRGIVFHSRAFMGRSSSVLLFHRNGGKPSMFSILLLNNHVDEIPLE